MGKLRKIFHIHRWVYVDKDSRKCFLCGKKEKLCNFTELHPVGNNLLKLTKQKWIKDI